MDLELRAASGLDVLVKALDPKMHALHHDRHFARFELNQEPLISRARCFADPSSSFEISTRRFAKDGSNAAGGTLDIGIAAPGRTDRAVQAGYVLSEKTVALAAAEGVEIAIYGLRSIATVACRKRSSTFRLLLRAKEAIGSRFGRGSQKNFSRLKLQGAPTAET